MVSVKYIKQLLLLTGLCFLSHKSFSQRFMEYFDVGFSTENCFIRFYQQLGVNTLLVSYNQFFNIVAKEQKIATIERVRLDEDFYNRPADWRLRNKDRESYHIKEICDYDEEGFLISRSLYDDSIGNLIHTENYIYRGDSSQLSVTVENNKLIKRIYFFSTHNGSMLLDSIWIDADQEVWQFIYEEANNLLSMVFKVKDNETILLNSLSYKKQKLGREDNIKIESMIENVYPTNSSWNDINMNNKNALMAHDTVTSRKGWHLYTNDWSVFCNNREKIMTDKNYPGVRTRNNNFYELEFISTNSMFPVRFCRYEYLSSCKPIPFFTDNPPRYGRSYYNRNNANGCKKYYIARVLLSDETKVSLIKQSKEIYNIYYDQDPWVAINILTTSDLNARNLLDAIDCIIKYKYLYLK